MLRTDTHTHYAEIKEGREVTSVGLSRLRVSQFMEELVRHRFHRRQPQRRCILQQLRNQQQTLRREGLAPEDFGPRARFDLREFVFRVVWVHGADLLLGGGAEHFDDLDELVNAGFTREDWLAEHQFRHDAAGTPYIF